MTDDTGPNFVQNKYEGKWLLSSVMYAGCMSPKGTTTAIHKHQNCAFSNKYNIRSSAIGFGNHQKLQIVVEEAPFSPCLCLASSPGLFPAFQCYTLKNRRAWYTKSRDVRHQYTKDRQKGTHRRSRGTSGSEVN